ncbi:PhzF family phenazine biosynthesis protein [Aeromonas salmonicida subsp. salmonicida]|uniref:Phenazine biosynthesis family protein n=2 Tax=Aeromonas salmonicida subsp. salmonicida TaxID=29491 RepID=A4SN07_AERS4|nr:PhzF family phenazine biosynthesis protein [Aeromonas salmonicida]ABO90279.1 phenazine biosynthesis family protein [Aeromonas salmonicida subsp. salmonicida A449]ASI23527.1 PhzF family phenazine biosynthesis protein [Aeromonas salmonicida]ASI27844.1 PhzF family phenazine biosynthesis protein [Aeromonas salmonicida]ASI31975.1 PhzF family phenazine biosynthesis protein [Aeromonas salmonicida]ATD38926.1 PhzF family phenazine biosynthesis protein [Aeromonas salmonicida subsp. masoucida]
MKELASPLEPELVRIAAFSDGLQGGNPAGVWIGASLPGAHEMQHIAAEVGFSETAFAAPMSTRLPQGVQAVEQTAELREWRVRYFSPEAEVPFCGHATIALGVALAQRFGEGEYGLHLNQAVIKVSGWLDGEGHWQAALQSPPTHSKPAPAELVAAALDLFGYTPADLDPRIPPALIHGGADHLVLALNSRAALAAMEYELEQGRTLMRREGLVTILLAHAAREQLFHTRNPFAYGGVYEDPATGAATAAFAGYLRDIHWPHGGIIDLFQGEDMGMASHLHAEIPAEPGSSIRVFGRARLM